MLFFLDFTGSEHWAPFNLFSPRVGGGGKGTPDFKWQGWLNVGKTWNPKKSHAEFPSHRDFQIALNDITRKTETLVLNYTQKNSYLNQATWKNTYQNFPTPKNPEIEK